MFWNVILIFLALIGLFDLPDKVESVVCAIFLYDVIYRITMSDNHRKLIKSPMIYIDLISVIPCFAPLKAARVFKIFKMQRRVKPLGRMIAKLFKSVKKII